VTVQAVTMPTTSRPRSRPVTSSTACRTAPAAAMTARACSSAAAPAGVSVAVRPDRSISAASQSAGVWSSRACRATLPFEGVIYARSAVTLAPAFLAFPACQSRTVRS
jgi:hypothetical protein